MTSLTSLTPLTPLTAPAPELRKPGPAEETWRALGTSAVLRVDGGDLSDLKAARRAAESEIDAIDAAASRFSPDSELSVLNRADGAWVKVSPLLFEAVSLGLRAAELTDGAVDPTLGDSLIAAGYDRDWHELTPLPVDCARDRSRPPRLTVVRHRRPRWQAVELADTEPGIRLAPGVELDLGATAKALAADRAAGAAHRITGAGVLVALGGDIATHGPAPLGGWRIHVTEDHRSGPHAPGQTVSIDSGGLATSSVGVRRWLHNGRAMHHILDPRDGEPVRSPWQTVSVAAATCADANIASTAAIVIGDRAPAWLAKRLLPARLVSISGAVLTGSGWPR